MTLNGISTIGTLGENPNDVTCSVLATKSLGSTFEIAAFHEFEIAAEALIADQIDAMIVPGAYPKISSFIMNRRLAVLDVFLYPIPSLVFVSKYTKVQNKYHFLYNHPATNPLLKDIQDTIWNENVNVTSNTMACLMVLQEESCCCAVTNAACAQRYDLPIHQVLRSSIHMPFVIFVKK